MIGHMSILNEEKKISNFENLTCEHISMWHMYTVWELWTKNVNKKMWYIEKCDTYIKVLNEKYHIYKSVEWKVSHL